MLIGFIIGGFIFFTVMIYFIILAIWPEWVGVSGRDHQKTLQDQREPGGQGSLTEGSNKEDGIS